jgi:hypothetical protein
LLTAFQEWRRSRPFWAGVWTLLAGAEIISIPMAPLSLMIHEGVAGVSGALMGLFMVILAITLWLAPGHRVFAGIATLVFAVASLVLSNFGGFLVGFLLGVLGGAMAVSWGPDTSPAGPAKGDWGQGGGGGGGGPDRPAGPRNDTPKAHDSGGTSEPRGESGGKPSGSRDAEGTKPAPETAAPGGTVSAPAVPPVSPKRTASRTDAPADAGDMAGAGDTAGSGHVDTAADRPGSGRPGAVTPAPPGARDTEEPGSPAPGASAPGRTVFAGGAWRVRTAATRVRAGAGSRSVPAASALPRLRGAPRRARLRVIGALPAGGALLAGGLQPMSPAVFPAISAPVARTGSSAAPVQRPDRHGQPPLTVCSLLDGLFRAGGQTVHGIGSGRPGATPRHPGRQPEGPHYADPHGTPDTTLPGQRSAGPVAYAPSGAPAPATAAAPDGSGTRHRDGLVGTVTGMLGLRPAPSATLSPTAPAPGSPAPSADPRATSFVPSPAVDPRPAPDAAGRPPASRSGAAPRDGQGHGGDGAAGADHPASPSVLDLSLPSFRSGGAMNGSLSPLPPRIRLGGSDGRHSSEETSPWCLPSVSLKLSAGAAAYGVRTAAAQPFRVRTPLLVLTALTYRGITTVRTDRGPQRVLAFTARRLDIASLRQTAPLLPPDCAGGQAAYVRPPFVGLPGIAVPPLGVGLPGIGFVPDSASDPWAPCQGTLATDGARGRTVTATGRPVVLLTKVLSGRLLGLLPVTFTPDMPPPLPPGLTLPIPIFFTHVIGDNQFLGADRLAVPGLAQRTYF